MSKRDIDETSTGEKKARVSSEEAAGTHAFNGAADAFDPPTAGSLIDILQDSSMGRDLRSQAAAALHNLVNTDNILLLKPIIFRRVDNFAFDTAVDIMIRIAKEDVFAIMKFDSLLTPIVSALKEDRDPSKTLDFLHCLSYLLIKAIDELIEDRTRCQRVKAYIEMTCSHEVGLLEAVFVVIKKHSPGRSLERGLHILVNLLGKSMSHRRDVQQITSSSLGWIATLLAIMENDAFGETKRTLAMTVLWNIAEECTQMEAQDLIAVAAHRKVFLVLQSAGPVCVQWNDLAKTALNFLMNLARLPLCHKPLLEIGTLDVMRPILRNEDNGHDSLKAIFVVAFLVGDNEPDEKKKPISDLPLHDRPDAIGRLIEVLATVVKRTGGVDYKFGTFTLKLVLQACLVVSRSDYNKSKLAEGPLVSLLKRVLDAFVRDEPSSLCGGGGEDVESTQRTIEILAQLALFQSDDDKLQLQLMAPESEILSVLESINLNQCLWVKLSEETQYHVHFLLARLSKRSLGDGGAREILSLGQIVPLPTRSHTHIMLSYTWAEGAFPQRVRAVGAELRRLGYDVWSDQEGSGIQSPMRGSTYEAMGRALDNASIVVVFVSRQYKDRINCRSEIEYARKLQDKKKLKMVFVMMQIDYTPDSMPDYCDGYLGLIIGPDIYYGLYSDDRIQHIARDIINEIPTEVVESLRPDARMELSAMSARSQSTELDEACGAPGLTFSTSPTDRAVNTTDCKLSGSGTATGTVMRDPPDFIKAWDILRDPIRVKPEQQARLAELLDDEGVYDHDDIQVTAQSAQREDVEKLTAWAECLKNAPRKQFLKAVGL